MGIDAANYQKNWDTIYSVCRTPWVRWGLGLLLLLLRAACRRWARSGLKAN